MKIPEHLPQDFPFIPSYQFGNIITHIPVFSHSLILGDFSAPGGNPDYSATITAPGRGRRRGFYREEDARQVTHTV